MEAEDDKIVFVVVDALDDEMECIDDEQSEESDEIIIKEEKIVTIKTEIDDDFEYEYLEDADFLEELEDVKSEAINKDDEDEEDTENVRRKPLKPSQYRSYVAELRDTYPELRKNEELLVDILAKIMRRVKTPPLPEKYYKPHDMKFMCIYCEYLSPSLPAAGRHYQERHGSYYLMCFACGFEFRCTLNLYRHEKRCRAPDAQVVLRARALSIGTKARGRPYIECIPQEQKTPISYPCGSCSAVFVSKISLMAHENMHRGLRPYHCDTCSNAYTSPHALYRHMKVHKNMEFICDYCNRSFKMKHILVDHMNTHRPKKFECAECGRKYAHKAAYTRHVDKIHRLLPPPCVCPVCPKRFMRMPSLQNHMRKAHKSTLISRNMFQKAFPKMSDTRIQSLLKLYKK